MRNQTRHTHDNLVKHGDEAGWHFLTAHPRPEPRDSIRDCEIWSDRLPLVVVPLGKRWNGVSVISEVLDLHNVVPPLCRCYLLGCRGVELSSMSERAYRLSRRSVSTSIAASSAIVPPRSSAPFTAGRFR